MIFVNMGSILCPSPSSSSILRERRGQHRCGQEPVSHRFLWTPDSLPTACRREECYRILQLDSSNECISHFFSSRTDKGEGKRKSQHVKD